MPPLAARSRQVPSHGQGDCAHDEGQTRQTYSLLVSFRERLVSGRKVSIEGAVIAGDGIEPVDQSDFH
ncbi:hypothetical protein D3C87_2028060 [compost metagenome]